VQRFSDSVEDVLPLRQGVQQCRAAHLRWRRARGSRSESDLAL